MLKSYSSRDRNECLLELAQEAFERWHKKLTSSSTIWGQWVLRIHPPSFQEFPESTPRIDSLVVMEGDAKNLTLALERDRDHPSEAIPWNLRRYLTEVSQDASPESIYSSRREQLLPHFEGEFASDLSVLAIAGVLYTIDYNNICEKRHFVRKRLPAVADIFLKESSFLSAPDWFSRTRRMFLENIGFTPQNDRIILGITTAEYISHTETIAMDGIKRLRATIDSLEQNLLRIEDRSFLVPHPEIGSDDSSSWEDTVDTTGSSDNSEEESEDPEEGGYHQQQEVSQ